MKSSNSEDRLLRVIGLGLQLVQITVLAAIAKNVLHLSAVIAAVAP